jgi:YVTN family beta-propeller protein
LGRVLALVALCWLSAATAAAQGSYTLFESGPVRPLALSPDGTTLFACNIPDARLEIFQVTYQGLVHSGSVPVGLEPVAVAARNAGEVWVVNHLSDSVSIVDVATQRVTRTLLVGDEPRDIVFGGAARDRAFITAAHRGQNRPGDPQLLDGGVGRSDVWVFDANNLGAALGGTPLVLLNLFGDTPRALAVTPDGATVYAAVFHSGDQTTTMPIGTIPQIGPFQTLPTGLSSPDVTTLPTPDVGLMMKQVGPTTWQDAAGTVWANKVPFSLPDHDVFAIDANATPPAQSSVYDHVGTILFNMAVNPVSGVVYVSNSDANNMDRFEGFGATSLRGELHRAAISILSGASTVVTRRLNKHIDYGPAVAPPSVNAASLGIPTDMAVSSDGNTLYVAAFGSQEVGVINTAALALDPNDPNSFQPSAASHIALSAGGPGGLVLDEANHHLYVYTRFDDGISIVSKTSQTEIAHLRVHSPEPASVTTGRRFLYDTHFSSSNGEASCGSCHVFADFDSLAWDLGAPSPDGAVVLNDNPFVKIVGTTGPAVVDSSGITNIDFHPLKGPMTTQTLRGMKHNGPMHWRGDRSGGTGSSRTPNWDPQPDGTAANDPNLGFQKFNGAFVSLLGRSGQISAGDMQAFTDFALQLQLPPNPIASFDGSFSSAQSAGLATFVGPASDGATKNCIGCHVLDPAHGHFGTSGLTSFSAETQHFKVPHLRNAYQKVGMYGRNQMTVGQNTFPGHGSPTTDQVRGFGYLNDGSADTIVSFLQGSFFSPLGGPAGDPTRANLANFLFAFPSDLAPIVGQQVTLRSDNGSDPAVIARLNLLVARAGTAYPNVDRNPNNECDLVVKGRIGGAPRGWWMSSPGVFTSDSSDEATIADSDLRALAATPGQDLTYTCTPPGSGPRMGIDRGGVGDDSQPDGILDSQQCGDTDGDGIASSPDVAATRALLAGISTPPAPGKCNVAGDPGSDPASCDVLDVAVLRRALAGLSPAPTTGCAN